MYKNAIIVNYWSNTYVCNSVKQQIIISDVEKHQLALHLALFSGAGCLLSCLHSASPTILPYKLDVDRQRDIIEIKHTVSFPDLGKLSLVAV